MKFRLLINCNPLRSPQKYIMADPPITTKIRFKIAAPFIEVSTAWSIDFAASSSYSDINGGKFEQRDLFSDLHVES